MLMPLHYSECVLLSLFYSRAGALLQRTRIDWSFNGRGRRKIIGHVHHLNVHTSVGETSLSSGLVGCVYVIDKHALLALLLTDYHEGIFYSLVCF